MRARALLATVVLTVGCGSDEADDRPAPVPAASPTSTQLAEPPPVVTERTVPSKPAAPPDAEREPEPRTSSDGTRFTPPAEPDRTEVTEATRCVDGAPPRPALSARYSGPRRISVEYASGDLPASCRTASITVVVDVNDDTSAGISNQWRMNGPSRVVREVRIPGYFRGRPDVVTAIAVSEAGRVSQPARVLIEGR